MRKVAIDFKWPTQYRLINFVTFSWTLVDYTTNFLNKFYSITGLVVLSAQDLWIPDESNYKKGNFTKQEADKLYIDNGKHQQANCWLNQQSEHPWEMRQYDMQTSKSLNAKHQCTNNELLHIDFYDCYLQQKIFIKTAGAGNFNYTCSLLLSIFFFSSHHSRKQCYTRLVDYSS